MKTVNAFPYRVRHVEHTLIPVRDGVRLAARMWIPDDATTPVPALLEFIPYRKRDMTRARDALSHPYFAGHGYASVRVDLRGSGDSDGVLTDEYLEQEQLDALDILAWLEAQPWCNGWVGMFGISWGGFNALQVAALRPPQLGAIVTVASTDDRY
ncbi:MAG: CocE/NonD family hydrolase, partial [bacterium]